jgi:UDP-N-acetylmuramate--alanine ligase
MLNNKKYIHFIGIGGIGMSGLAAYLQYKGFKITGSDLENSENTERLQRQKIPVIIGHSAANISNPDLVVYTSAINDDNPELQAAQHKKIPITSRAELLAEVCKLTRYTVAVAGTHGKTTTTSMLGVIFKEAGLNPVVISGGIIKNVATNIVTGGDYVTVVEADEYDQSFLHLHADFAVITNIDEDHMECYGDLKNLKHHFLQFAGQVRQSLVLCRDNESLTDLATDTNCRKIYYSTTTKSDIFADKITYHETETKFFLNGKEKISMHSPGLHNVQNALAAIAVAREFNIDTETIKSALAKFQGVKRRFEIVFQNNDHILVDDYAHHPEEVRATISSAKNSWPHRQLLVIFQPHLYSRTQYFYKEFANALAKADKIVVTDIYPAREKPIKGVSGKMIFDELQKNKTSQIAYAPKEADWAEKLMALQKPEDIIISFGAGDINKVHKTLIKQLNQ